MQFPIICIKAVFSKPLRLPTIRSSLKKVFAVIGSRMKAFLTTPSLSTLPGIQQELGKYGLSGE